MSVGRPCTVNDFDVGSQLSQAVALLPSGLWNLRFAAMLQTMLLKRVRGADGSRENEAKVPRAADREAQAPVVESTYVRLHLGPKTGNWVLVYAVGRAGNGS